MPVLIATPFATNGTKNDIPETTGAQPQNATMDEGFPEITQQPISTGGIPPERADFNGILYALSDNISHINKGLAYSFDTAFATKIGGYPLHAELVMADGTRVVSTIANNMNNPDVDLTGWVKDNSASQIFDESGLTQQEINNSQLTVDNFGAKGDGVTDDSAAFQAYCDSALTGVNIRLAQRKAVYVIKKQVDCKGKGIVGNGFSKQNETAYSTSSIRVAVGDFSNSNPDLDNTAFINVGAEVRDLQLKGDSVSTMNGLQVSGYNTTIRNINIDGFGNQVYVVGGTVSFRVSDLMSISAGNAGFYFKDINSDQSTTAYFERCSWQWGKAPIIFEKEVYGCSFKNIIIEYMETGLTAKVWSNCIFDGVWAEETRGGAASDWLINTQNQQSFSNQYSNLYIRSPWTNRADPNAISASDAVGGVTVDDSQISTSGATGAKIVLSPQGIKTRFANWFGSSNNPKSTRRLSIASQSSASESNYKTPITIDAPNGCLYIRNLDDNDYTPVTVRTLIGSNADNSDAYYGVDSYTKVTRKWSTFEHTTNTSGQFLAPLMLTYDSTYSDAQQQVNAGWRITKEAGTTGVYILQRISTTVKPMTNPNIIVGGFHMASRVGNGTFVTASIMAIETYSGSWSSYTEGAGFKIFCRDQSGAQVNVNRFTAMFTLVSGF